MATERQSRQQGEQRSVNQPVEESAGEGTQRAAGRGGKQGGFGSEGQRSQLGEYQRGTSMPSLYSGFGEGPFAMMRRLSDEMDRLFEGFGIGRGLSPFGRGMGNELQSLWTPRVDMCERGDKLVVSVDLPGLKRDDVNV